MKKSIACCASLLLFLLVWAEVARAETAPEAFARGRALLAEADFDGALQSFARAARADRNNREYLDHFAMVRRVVALRQNLDTERDPGRWEYIARGLHAFYVGQKLHGEALSLDREIHARLGTAASAKMLAETQLSLDLNTAAAATLVALGEAKHTPATRALYGLALVRLGRMDEAREIAAKIDLGDDAGPGTIYSVARLHAALGDADKALALLASCFESVAPSRLDGFKTHARLAPEFAALAATPRFAEVMAVESKVAESKCSGGSRCAGCPMRGKCSGGK